MTDYERRIAAILSDLGIDETGLRAPLQIETAQLVSLGEDVFGREQLATPATAEGWARMRDAASESGVILDLVSAWRSVDYQSRLIRKKLEAGQVMDDILCVNAAPGFSEHHTGRALDLNTPGCEPLTEAFETTVAFDWLTRYAAEFGFVMSYPRDNPFGIIYEPWHWAYQFDA